MQTQAFVSKTLKADQALNQKLEEFVAGHKHGNFFQSPGFFHFINEVDGYKPVQVITTDESGKIKGSLLGVYQSNGSNIKSWLSRRLIIWGGPLVTDEEDQEVIKSLLEGLKKHGQGKAIYIEFRNFYDMSGMKGVFEQCGFQYRDHLNLLVKTDEETLVRKRIKKSRMQRIKTSLKKGAIIKEAETEAEVIEFYAILEELYRDKVKKPLPALDLFLRFQKNPDLCKFFVIVFEGEVIGGSVCPIFGGKTIYAWYVCGDDRKIKGMHPSALANWAAIEFGFQNNYDEFDFLGAGKPDEDYGVRTFKASFGAEEVCFGRFNLVLNKQLYKVGQLGLKVYQKIK